MINNDRTTKILLSILAIGFILWFGGSVVRTAIGYDLFNPDAQLELKNYAPEIRMHSVYLFANLAIYTGVGYGVSFLFSIITFFKIKKDLKTQGWLFMAFVLFLLASPIQLYLIYLDYGLAMEVVRSGLRDFNSYIVQQNFYQRFVDTKLTVMSSLSFLANLTALVYFIWKPLQKPE